MAQLGPWLMQTATRAILGRFSGKKTQKSPCGREAVSAGRQELRRLTGPLLLQITPLSSSSTLSIQAPHQLRGAESSRREVQQLETRQDIFLFHPSRLSHHFCEDLLSQPETACYVFFTVRLAQLSNFPPLFDFLGCTAQLR